MEIIREAEFRREIKRSPEGGYLFFGDEDYLKTADVQAAKQLICPDESLAVFNYLVFDAPDFSHCLYRDKLEMVAAACEAHKRSTP